MRQGDPIDLFGYPLIGGDTLTYTNGVVSGFNFEEGIDGPAWITTNATMAGGSSGGTALDRDGRLIGVPTQGSALDCRPGDTNLDGRVDAQDVGCIPIGGSIGLLRPINLAQDLLARSGASPNAGSRTPAPTPVPNTPDPMPTGTALLAPTPTSLPNSDEVPATVAPTPFPLPHNVEGLGGDASISAALGYFPPAIAEACTVSPVYAIGDHVVLKRGAEISPGGLSGNAQGYFQGWLPAGTAVEITGRFIESGD